VVSVLDIGPKVHGLKPGRGRWNFIGDKNPQHDALRSGSNILRLFKITVSIKEILRWQNSRYFVKLSSFTTRSLCWQLQERSSKLIRNDQNSDGMYSR
jgi:hypothetical protein